MISYSLGRAASYFYGGSFHESFSRLLVFSIYLDRAKKVE